MKKVLQSSISALVILILCIALGISIGVVATTNANKNMNFNLGVKYTAEYLVKVELGLDMNDDGVIGEAEYIIVFNSSTPTDVEYNSAYVKNIIGSTLSLNSEIFQPDSSNYVNIKITNLGDAALSATVGLASAITIAATATETVQVDTTDKQLGLWLLNIEFASIPQYTIEFTTTDIHSSPLEIDGGYYVTIINSTNTTNNINNKAVVFGSAGWSYTFNSGDELAITIYTGGYVIEGFTVSGEGLKASYFTPNHSSAQTKYEMASRAVTGSAKIYAYNNGLTGV